jgi:hypothetical protein
VHKSLKGVGMNNEDEKYVDLLSLFHYVLGIITALFSCMPFIHVFIGLAMISGKMFADTSSSSPPDAFGWIFVIMGSVFILIGWTIAICMLIAGRKLKMRKSRMFCMIVAGVECMFMPFGTVLGVFTLVGLNKESIKDMFEN